MNPFTFLQLYLGKYPRALKQLVTLHSLMACSESKCTGEIYRGWVKNNLGWPNEYIRNMSSFWGAWSR